MGDKWRLEEYLSTFESQEKNGLVSLVLACKSIGSSRQKVTNKLVSVVFYVF